jgi:hypothetical protein
MFAYADAADAVPIDADDWLFRPHGRQAIAARFAQPFAVGRGRATAP